MLLSCQGEKPKLYQEKKRKEKKHNPKEDRGEKKGTIGANKKTNSNMAYLNPTTMMIT